jgi:hypothetical protein
MQDLERALADIGTIRNQLARDTQFHGYGPATVAATGAIAASAGIVQAIWIPSPIVDIGSYLILWIGVAAISIGLIGIETVTRSRRLHSGLADDMVFAAVEQLIPAAAAGALLTSVIARFAPEGLPMLPGLWQVVFSLGIFASARSLPRSVVWAGVWYLACGAACLAMARGQDALSPWAMGLPFGIGQLLAAALLHRGLAAQP